MLIWCMLIKYQALTLVSKNGNILLGTNFFLGIGLSDMMFVLSKGVLVTPGGCSSHCHYHLEGCHILYNREYVHHVVLISDAIQY